MITNNKIKGWFLRRISDRHDAEDLTQEVRLRLMFRDIYSYNYIWITCRSVLNTYLRRRYKEEQKGSLSSITWTTPLDYAIGQEIYNAFSPEMKLYADGYTYREIKKKLGVSEHKLSNQIKGVK